VSAVLEALLAAATPPVAAFLWAIFDRLIHAPQRFVGTWISSGAVGLVVGIAEKDMAWLVGSAVSVAVGVAIWWWRRKDRKRAAKALGAKSCALVAALVERAREAARPRPVLQPQRGGAS
jgi:hypothetical protein